MKRILGLDLGTNSIGAALIESTLTDEGKEELRKICYCGSRIIPMDATKLGDFEKGNPVSQTADRTESRSIRHLYERSKLRRERLHRVLDLMGFLPYHYSECLTRYGKFQDGMECKLPWVKDAAGKYHFLFEDSFQEMLADFAVHQPQLVGGDKKIPYDWTIYYLRKKALSEKITKEELAWVLLNFNQKRGYYQLRGEVEKKCSDNKSEKYYSLNVVKVEALEEKKGDSIKYNVEFENGMIWQRFSKIPLFDWEGKKKDIIVTSTLDEDGNPKKDKEGNYIRTFRNPGEDDWTLLKVKTEKEIEESQETVGAYIYDALLKNMHQKVRGKLIHTIERKFYKDELGKILESQKRFHKELSDRQLFLSCLDELYPNNEGHRNLRSNQGFVELFIDDILFYQRPLKSKKSLISDCPYESHVYIDKDGKKKSIGIKCIPLSHPLFQEFRLWQFISNLRIYQKERRVNGKLEQDVDVTSEFIKSDEDRASLFEKLNDTKEINQKSFLKYWGLDEQTYRWNYVEDESKKYPCNDTRAKLLDYLEKAKVSQTRAFLAKEKEVALWHLLYSIEDKQELEKALCTFANRNDLEEQPFVKAFAKFPPFKKDYGAYSAKAISKLLPLMRCGKFWSEDAFDENTRLRIQHIIDGECDDAIRNRVREKTMHLPIYLALSLCLYGLRVISFMIDTRRQKK